MAQGPLALVFSYSSHPWTCAVLFELFLFLTFYFFLLFLFLFLFLMTDGDSMTINNLRDSANGIFVTLDDYSHSTGYEPNAMELNDAVSSDFIDFQDSLVHFAPSSDHYMDDDTLGKLLAEVHRDCADYRRPEGVSVSPSSMSVMVDRTGKPVEEMIAEERESSSAQIRTLFNEQRKTIIAECCEKFLITNLLAAQAEQERKIL